MELLKFSNDIEASDTERRIIAGKIVPYATEIGNTSAGKVIFAADSIEIPANKKIKLLDEHNPKAILGSATTFTKSDDGVYATFKVTKTTRGDEALTLASDGLKTGLSVGVEPIESSMNQNGVIVVTKGILREVSHVASPAFASAEITQVAASEESPAETVEITPTPNESEATQVEDTTKEAVAPEAVETPSVEASRPTVAASVAYTKPRINVTKRDYVANTLKANLFQDEEARQWIKAADNDQSSAAGFIPTPQSTELLNFLSNADRPVIDSISRGTMPAYGKTFELPKITAVPVVDQIDENAAVTESTLEADYLTVTKKSFKGRAISTLELLSNSTPAFLDELVRQMEVAYAKETETYATDAIQSASPYVPVPGFANDADDLLKFVATSASLIYKDSLGFANNIVVTPEQWANIMSYNDNGRPIYIASNPVNNAGVLSPASVSGTVAGLQLRVSRYIDGGVDNVGNGSMAIINPEAYTWYEDSRQQLRTNINSDGTVDILLFGQGALATKLANGVRWFRKA